MVSRGGVDRHRDRLHSAAPPGNPISGSLGPCCPQRDSPPVPALKGYARHFIICVLLLRLRTFAFALGSHAVLGTLLPAGFLLTTVA